MDFAVRTRIAVAALGLSASLALAGAFGARAAEPARPLPAAALNVPERGRAVAVFAGGCFWGMEAVFSHLAGVQSVVSGYAGGTRATATYGLVSAERTDHAEVVRVTYDPARISYATLLRVFFSVAHDPTQLNRQTPDVGRSYRSAIFPQTADQARMARAYIDQLGRARTFPRPIVTRIEQGAFFAAEAEHQDFAVRNPTHPYITRWDVPRVERLRVTFPALWQARPAA